MTSVGTTDCRVRKEVTCPRGSFLLRAPAGSGKTTILVDRYCELLGQSGVEPEHILCVTFTRKAAGEMRKKIEDRIQAKFSEYRNRVNVQTIDGFQHTLARSDSLRARILPGFRGTARDGILHRAVAEAAEAKEVCKEVCEKTKHSPRYIYRRMVRMLKKRDQWLPRPEDKKVFETEEVFKALCKMAEGALKTTQSVEREYDYIAVSEAATRLLKAEKSSQSDGASRRLPLERVLGYPILHVLVDEFQDVSAAQFRFLKALVELWDESNGKDETGRTSFFAVGDTMQAIYRFRGAGTETIWNMFEAPEEAKGRAKGVAKIGRVKLHVRSLVRNFRSAKTVVDGVFGLLCKGGAPVRKTGEAKLVRAQAAREMPGKVTLTYFEPHPDKEPEAAWVAERMKECRRKRELAVLVRARRHFTEYIEPRLETLEDIDVAFTPLDRQACVNDLCTLGRCLEDPGNDVAALALLRSPLLCLRGEEIRSIYVAAGRGGGENRRSRPLKWLLEGGWKEWTHGRAIHSARAMEEFVGTYWRARTDMRTSSVRVWLERAWFRVGGDAIYWRREDRANVRQVLECVEEASGDRRRCDWGELERQLKGTYGASRYPAAKVKVMTIHAAKGLEFERVIVPFLDEPGPKVDRDLVIIGKGERALKEEALVDADSEAYNKAYKLEVGKGCEELRRLLYVAATRAKTDCWMSVTKPEKGKEFPKSSMIAQVKDVKCGEDLQRLDEAIRKRGGLPKEEKFVVQGEEGRGSKGAGPNSGERRTAELEQRSGARIVNYEQLRNRRDSVPPLCVQRASATGREAASDATDPQLAAVGIVVHEEIERVLTDWPVEGAARYQSPRWERQCRTDLREARAKDPDGAIEDVRGHMERILSDGDMKRLSALQEGGSGWVLEFEREFGQLDVEDERSRPPRADLLVWDKEREKCLVVEFKTGEEMDEYKAQVIRYQELVKGARPGVVVRTGGVLYYTWREKRLEWVSGEEEFDKKVFGAR